MDQNLIKITLNQLANLLFLPVEDLENVISKYNLREKRKRNFFWIPFLLVCFRCLLNGKTRHKDRSSLYKRLFNISLSKNAFSDRLSQLPSAFCMELIKLIQPRLNQIGSTNKRKKAKELVFKILAEDASVFHLDNRLLDIFKAIPGCGSAGLKLYANVNIVGENHFGCHIKHARFSDMKHKSQKPKNKRNEKTIEVRDRGWYKWKHFVKWVNEDRYFISRTKKDLNGLIVEVYKGNQDWYWQKYKDLDLEGYEEVDLLLKPYRSNNGVFRLEGGKVFTIRLKGKKRKDGNWYWYLCHLPNVSKLSFDDVHALYRARWQIEELFRELKQAFGGGRLRLRHPVSIINHVLMMIIAYLFCKCCLKKISHVYRRSLSGFVLDTIMQGTLRVLFIEIILKIVNHPDMSNKNLIEVSKAFCEQAYSPKRARSYRISTRGKAFKKMR